MLFQNPSALLDAVGTRFGPTPWITIMQERIDEFAAATDDHQWIHVDVARASASSLGGTIAHGYLTLSLFSAFLPHLFQVAGVDMGLNAGLNRVRFLSPVRAGASLRAVAELISAIEKPRGIEVVLSVTMEVEGESRPACVMEPVLLFVPAD